MSRDRLLLLPLVAVLFVLGACQSEGKLTGEVFIVTEGRENIEMGLVEVKAIPAEKLNNALQDKFEKSRKEIEHVSGHISQSLDSIKLQSIKQIDIKKSIDSKRREINKLMDNIENQSTRMNSVSDISDKRIEYIRGGPTIGDKITVYTKNTKLKEKPITNATVKHRLQRGESGVIVEIDTLWDSYLVDFGEKRGWIWRFNAVPSNEWTTIKSKKSSISSELENTYARLKTLENTVEKLQSRKRMISEKIASISYDVREDLSLVRRSRSNEFYFSSLPSPSDVDKTGSDGEFELNVKADVPYYVVAQAERSVADEEENFYWMVKTTVEGGEVKEVNLTNDNLGGVANMKYVLNERRLSTVNEVWQSAISLAKEGKELNWEKLIYRTAFPQDSTDVPIPDELDVPEEKLVSNQ